MIVVACGLVFYAVGIATNLFASSVFSMFFVISYQTAHSIVVYIAGAAGFALFIVAFALSMVEKPEERTEPVAPRKVPSEKPITAFKYNSWITPLASCVVIVDTLSVPT